MCVFASVSACVPVPSAAGLERPLLDSPRDLEEGLDGMHLGQRGVSVGQLDGGDAQRPNITAGVVRVVVLLLAGDDLHTNTQTQAVRGSGCGGFSQLAGLESEGNVSKKHPKSSVICFLVIAQHF